MRRDGPCAKIGNRQRALRNDLREQRDRNQAPGVRQKSPSATRGTTRKTRGFRSDSVRAGSVDFDQRIQLNIGGKIGDKIELGTQYNTQSLFDFENQMNIGFQGEEDDILKNIEAGEHQHVPLEQQFDCGVTELKFEPVKLETQWGRLYNTTVFSQQKGERSEIEVEGGAQTQEFDIRADDYEANRHYFLSQYFVDQYDEANALVARAQLGGHDQSD